MNIPGITRALELDDADWDLAVKLRGLTEHQREQFSAAIGPAKPSKKSSKKSAGGGRRSTHSESLKRQISNRAQSSQPLTTTDNNDDDGTTPRCQAPRGDGRVCMLLADHNIHHLPTAMDYHEFVPPAEQAAGASGD